MGSVLAARAFIGIDASSGVEGFIHAASAGFEASAQCTHWSAIVWRCKPRQPNMYGMLTGLGVVPMFTTSMFLLLLSSAWTI